MQRFRMGTRLSKKEMLEGVSYIKSKKLALNTVEYYKDYGTRVIRLFKTDILTFMPDGSVIINSGGHRTQLTKGRINEHLPPGFSISQDKGLWYLVNGKGSYNFRDNMTINPDGSVIGYDVNDQTKKAAKLKKEIKEFVKTFMEKLVAGEIPAPSQGDCWFCYFKTQDGISMGDAGDPADHLLSHIREKYYVPSLLGCAKADYPIPRICESLIAQLWYNQEPIDNPHFKKMVKDYMGKSLKRYIHARLGFAG